MKLVKPRKNTHDDEHSVLVKCYKIDDTERAYTEDASNGDFFSINLTDTYFSSTLIASSKKERSLLQSVFVSFNYF